MNTPIYRRVGTRTFYLAKERPVLARRVSTSHLGHSVRGYWAEMGRFYVLSRDRTFLRADLRWDVLTRRAEIGRSYASSRDRTFLLPPDNMCNFHRKTQKRCWKNLKKNFGAHLPYHILSVLGGFQNMRKMANTHYPLPKFFANQMNISYSMRFFNVLKDFSIRLKSLSLYYYAT